MIKKGYIALCDAALVIAVALVEFCRSPYRTALLKPKDHFIVHSGDNGILYEPGAEDHDEFVAHPSSYPIRGPVLLGNVFTAQSAFDFQNMDTHREPLLHELSHLHLLQHLGFFGYRKIPIWFTEGLANCLAGSE